MCSNIYDDVKDFEVCGFIKNTKIKLFSEGTIIFPYFFQMKKVLIVHLRSEYGKR